MAITRYDVNGNLAALKTALEALTFFASVDYDDDTTPTKVQCRDADDNLIFETNGSVYTIYRSDGTSHSQGGGTNYSTATYLFKVGSKVAAFQCTQAKAHSETLVVFGKTNTGTIGFAIPRTFGATSVNADPSQFWVCAWDDDPHFSSSLSASLLVVGTMIGNSTQLANLPLHGTYGTPEYIENAFCLHCVQEGMRNLLQEITSQDGETYLTNGWVALLDDGGDET